VSEKTVFDQFADTYTEGHAKAIKSSGYSVDFFHEYKIQEMTSCLSGTDLWRKRINILNFGCGIGSSEKFIRKYFPESVIYGIDISGESIRVAKSANRSLKDVHFSSFDGENISLGVQFDLILAAGVFHHIPVDKRAAVLKNIHKNLRAGGKLFIFELNPFNPATMYLAAVNDYRFDKNASLLTFYALRRLIAGAGFSKPDVKFAIFLPGIFSALRWIERYLYRVPLGAHYYLVTEK